MCQVPVPGEIFWPSGIQLVGVPVMCCTAYVVGQRGVGVPLLLFSFPTKGILNWGVMRTVVCCD